ncbi:MAG TPA: ADOP family duplicated permease [Terriglobales bacterium]|nr:ADOP family duplicated permease [Terriglobales bacterium]
MTLANWLHSLRRDFVFGGRQILKNKITSAAAILSLALAIGACTSAFRLIDAVLLRPLPIRGPERLYDLLRQGVDPGGHFRLSDSEEYPLFQKLRTAAAGQADLIAVSFADRTDLTFGGDEEMEKAYRQYVSGWMFSDFGLQPALGRLLTPSDDLTPGAHPYAVISFDYWKRRFGRDRNVIGRNFRIGNDLYQIVGIAPEGFTGTEPGTAVDLFLPTMMNPWVTRDDAGWLRALVLIKPGVAPEQVLDRIRGPFQDEQERRAKTFTNTLSPKRIQDFLHQQLLLAPAGAGVSQMQKDYRAALLSLGGLVTLLLLIASANVANLLAAQASARSREMALRVSIGASRWRLAQLMLAEGTWLAMLAAALGALFAWWSAPLVVRLINPPDHPVHLVLPADWRVLGFGVALTIVVMLLFGLGPAVRASSVRPATALKGGDDPHSRRRLMHVLVGAQAAFCFVVLFVGALFVSSFDRLKDQPVGFLADRLLALDVVTQQPQPTESWEQVAQQVQTVPGVEGAALAGWPLLSGNGWNGFISVHDGPISEDLAYFLGVTPEWRDLMRIPLLEGRDLRPDESFPSGALVNQAFAERFFPNQPALGQWFEKTQGENRLAPMQIVGIVADARYRDMREPITPTAYVPFRGGMTGTRKTVKQATIMVRTSGANPLLLAPALRQTIARARPGFRVSNLETQQEINDAQTVRERVLASLAVFFSVVALLLAGIGLYGVLNYSVLQRRREIAVRMAVGAQAGDIVRRLTTEAFSMVIAGSLVGMGLGVLSARYLVTLLYRTTAADPRMIAIPSVALLLAAIASALRPAARAVQIQPAELLRSE